MTPATAKQRVRALFSDGVADQLIALRRAIHANPELSFQEYRTAESLFEALRALGVSDIQKIGNTGLVARVRGRAGL